MDILVDLNFLSSEKIGRERIYKNERLFNIIKNFDDNNDNSNIDDINIETAEKYES